MTVVTRSRAGRATDRDLRSVRAATAMMLKKKKKVATDRKLRSVHAATALRKKKVGAGAGTGIQKRKRPASASETEIQKRQRSEVPKAAAGRKTLAEASFILKLKKEAFGAIDLWEQRHVPGALERWVKAKAKEAKAEEAQPRKTQMVFKTKLSREFIDGMRMQQQGLIRDLPEEELVGRSEAFRRYHAMMMYINARMHTYQQALIDQYMSQGYAEDEDEVTE